MTTIINALKIWITANFVSSSEEKQFEMLIKEGFVTPIYIDGGFLSMNGEVIAL